MEVGVRLLHVMIKTAFIFLLDIPFLILDKRFYFVLSLGLVFLLLRVFFLGCFLLIFAAFLLCFFCLAFYLFFLFGIEFISFDG